MAASWGSSSGRSLHGSHATDLGRSARPDLAARGALLDQVAAARAARLRRAPRRSSTSGSPPARTCSSRTCSAAVRPARPRQSSTGTAPVSSARRTPRRRSSSVEPAEGVPARQGEQGPGEPVPAEVGGLPRLLGPARGQGRGDRPTDLGAAAVAATVGADEPERGVVRRPVGRSRRGRRRGRGRAGPRRRAAPPCVRRSRRRSARAWKTRTPGPDSPPCRRISCTRTPVRPSRWSRTASGSRLSATALRPHEPGVLDEQEGGVGRRGTGDRLAVVATADGAAEVVTGSVCPRPGQPARRGPGAQSRPRAARDRRGLGAGGGVELAEDVGDVHRDGLGG